jgi:beta-galactosidase
MDMWRQPKWAAFAYRSQKSPEDEIILEIASFWTTGDRSGGGNDPIYVFTNCDEIDVHVGEQYIGRLKPAVHEFPNLPHSPIKIEGLDLHWGGKFEALRVTGFLNNEQIAEKIISADSIPQNLLCYAEDTTLNADGIDMTRLVFKLVDQHDNRLPYAIQPVHFELLEGDAELIGENPFALVGGQAALFVKAGRTTGTVRIKASTARLEDVVISIELV